MTERIRVRGESPYEEPYGYSRAVRVGNRIVVSGTAPVWPDGEVDPDVGAQADRCVELIAKALAEVGAGLDHVVRTRMFITDSGYAEAVGQAHGRAFGSARPVTSMVVVAALIDPRWKVEIEAEALVPDVLKGT